MQYVRISEVKPAMGRTRASFPNQEVAVKAKRYESVIAALFAFSVLFVTTASAQTKPPCTYFTVVTKDRLDNVKQGLSADDVKWFQKNLAKKYPGVCYAEPAPTVPVVFYITVTPDVYHGTRVVTDTSRHSDPVSGTVTEQDGSTSQVSGTVETTTTSSTAVPYSVDYGIFTLAVERRRSDGKFDVAHRFQQKGLYNTLYGIPLGGKGHHPVHTVIEEAAKWINSGGLADSMQGVFDAHSGAFLPTKTPAEAPSSGRNTQDYQGHGVQQDYAQAGWAWTLKAAAQGSVEAQVSLGTLYAMGQSVQQDYAQAAAWYRRAAEQGDARAQLHLGQLYEEGNGVPHDYAKAAAWYRKAAEQGNAEAQVGLGELYQLGEGVPKDFSEAYFWLKVALAGKTPGGNPEQVRVLLDFNANQLTTAALSQAQERAQVWLAAHATKAQ